MPFYKYVFNRMLTLIQNLLVGHKLSEYHTGYRGFTRAVLEAGHRVHENPEDAARIFSGYGGKGSVEDLAAMLRVLTSR